MTPEGWAETTLGSIASLSGGSTPSRKVASYWAENGDGVPWATPTDVTSLPSGQMFISESSECVTNVGVSDTSLRVFPPRTVLMTSRATIGDSVLNSVPMSTNQGFCNFEASSQVDALFLAYWLRSKTDLLKSISGGSTFLEVSKASLRRLPIELPPLREQKKIAEIFASVDEAIQATQAVIDQTRKVKQGLLQQLLTRGIGHTRFKQSEIGEIPESWEVMTANELLENGTLLALKDGNHGSDYPRSHEFGSIGAPFLAASAVSKDGKIDLDSCPRLAPERATLLRIPPARAGDVILTHNATVGRVTSIPMDCSEVIVSTSTTYYRPDGKNLTADYLRAYFQSPTYQLQLNRVMGQTTRNQVPITAQKELVIVLPPPQEQAQVAAAADGIETNLSTAGDALARLRGLKRGLMQDLLTGRVRVAA